VSWFDDPNCEAAAIAEHAAVAYAVDFDFPSGHVRLWTWTGELILGGNTYTGTGTLGSISDTPERTQLTSEQWTYSLSGVDPTVIPESEIDNCFGRSCTEYEVWLNPETYAVIGYEIRREGTMGPGRRRDGKDPVIQIRCETRLALLELTDGWRYTTEHQEKFFSGDLGCDFARELESKEIIWAGKRAAPNVHPRSRGRTPSRGT
jgi:hypothetical protein